MRSAFVLLIGAALLSGIPARAATPAAATRGWIARCVAQLAAEAGSAKSKRLYCTCMHAVFEDNTQVSQSEMEHMYPPAHRACLREAGWD